MKTVSPSPSECDEIALTDHAKEKVDEIDAISRIDIAYRLGRGIGEHWWEPSNRFEVYWPRENVTAHVAIHDEDRLRAVVITVFDVSNYDGRYIHSGRFERVSCSA